MTDENNTQTLREFLNNQHFKESGNQPEFLFKQVEPTIYDQVFLTYKKKNKAHVKGFIRTFDRKIKDAFTQESLSKIRVIEGVGPGPGPTTTPQNEDTEENNAYLHQLFPAPTPKEADIVNKVQQILRKKSQANSEKSKRKPRND